MKTLKIALSAMIAGALVLGSSSAAMAWDAPDPEVAYPRISAATVPDGWYTDPTGCRNWWDPITQGTVNLPEPTEEFTYSWIGDGSDNPSAYPRAVTLYVTVNNGADWVWIDPELSVDGHFYYDDPELPDDHLWPVTSRSKFEIATHYWPEHIFTEEGVCDIELAATLSKSTVKTSQNAVVKVAVANDQVGVVTIKDGSKVVKRYTQSKDLVSVKLPKLKKGTHKLTVNYAGHVKLSKKVTLKVKK